MITLDRSMHVCQCNVVLRCVVCVPSAVVFPAAMKVCVVGDLCDSGMSVRMPMKHAARDPLLTCLDAASYAVLLCVALMLSCCLVAQASWCVWR